MSDSANIPTMTTLPELFSHEGVLAARELYANKTQKNALDTYTIHKGRARLPILLSYYQEKLAQTNPAIFRFLNPTQKANWLDDLQLTYYLLYAEYQLQEAEGRRYRLGPLNDEIQRCSQLIDKLMLNADPIDEPLAEEENESEYYLKFCGYVILAPYFVRKIIDFISNQTDAFSQRKTGSTIDAMSAVNNIRLYWVWAGGMLSSTLDLLPDDFFNVNQARTGVSSPAPITGYMSWVLYYFRFSLHLGLLLKHTIEGPWMKVEGTEEIEEAKIPTDERFTTQWDQRKFALLNDFIWATANMACFFWLRGGGVLGYIGNVVTAGLLLMDFCLTLWRFWEETTAHNARMLELRHARDELVTSLSTEEDPEKKRELENQLDAIAGMMKKTEFDWTYKRLKTINDLVYTGSLLMAFGLVTCFFCPPALIAPATMMIIICAGSSLCFLLNLTSSAVAGGIDVAQSKASRQDALGRCNDLLDIFKEEDDEMMQKQLYLKIRATLNESVFEKEMVTYNGLKLARSVVIDTLVPIVIFASLVFMPLGIGLGVMAAGVTLALLSHFVLKYFEPEAKKLPSSFTPDFEKGFEQFKNDPDAGLQYLMQKTTKGTSIFAETAIPTTEEPFDPLFLPLLNS